MAEPDEPQALERLFEAARTGDVQTLAALLDQHPRWLEARAEPYEWTLLHLAAHHGQLAAVDLLLGRGLDPNARERGDNTYPMHWAAAGGHLDIVRRLADGGGDVIGQGDDHQLEVIGWAACGPGCDDTGHRAVVDFLLQRGARHHVYSAIGLNLGDELRRIATADPAALERPMGHEEYFERPLHFAVRMNRPDMAALLLELGADPLGTDASGHTAAFYATAPGADRPIAEAIRARSAELDLLTAMALTDWAAAERLLQQDPTRAASTGALHLVAKRNDIVALRWLLAHGADPNGRWLHGDAEVRPLHLAAMQGHLEAARLLLEAGADPHLPDSKHDGDAIGWAHFFGHQELADMLRGGGAAPQLHPDAVGE